MTTNNSFKLHISIPDIQNTPENAIIFSLLSHLESVQNWLFANFIPIMSVAENAKNKPEIYFLGDYIGTTIQSCPYLNVEPLLLQKQYREGVVDQIINVIDKKKYILCTNEQKSFIQYQPHNKEALCSVIIFYGFNNNEKVIYASVFSPYKQRFITIPYSYLQEMTINTNNFVVFINEKTKEENLTPYEVLRDLEDYYFGKANNGFKVSPYDGRRHYGLSVLNELIKFYSLMNKCGQIVDVEPTSLVDIYSHQQLLSGVVEYFEICGLIDWRDGLYLKAANMESDIIKAIGLSIKYKNCPSEKIMNRLIQFLNIVKINEKKLLSDVFKRIQSRPQFNFFEVNEKYENKISIANRKIPFFGSNISFDLYLREDSEYKIFVDGAEYNTKQLNSRVKIGPLTYGYHNVYIDCNDKWAYIDSVHIKS